VEAIALDALRDLYPLSIPRKVSARHVECFAEYVLHAEPAPVDRSATADELAWIAARRGAMRLGGVYLPLYRGQA
jgi:hypothetical protein